MRDLRLPSRLKWILPPSGLLCGVRWFETDVSGLPVGAILKGQAIHNFLDSWTLVDDTRQVIPKRQFRNTLHRVITQKTEEFRSTAAEAHDLVYFVPRITFYGLYRRCENGCALAFTTCGRCHYVTSSMWRVVLYTVLCANVCLCLALYEFAWALVESRDSSVSIVTRLAAEQQRYRGSIPEMEFSSLKLLYRLWVLDGISSFQWDNTVAGKRNFSLICVCFRS